MTMPPPITVLEEEIWMDLRKQPIPNGNLPGNALLTNQVSPKALEQKLAGLPWAALYKLQQEKKIWDLIRRVIYSSNECSPFRAQSSVDIIMLFMECDVKFILERVC